MRASQSMRKRVGNLTVQDSSAEQHLDHEGQSKAVVCPWPADDGSYCVQRLPQ